MLKSFKKISAIIAARLTGWTIQGELPPNVKKIVLIGAPHTSNWDLFTTVCCAWYFGLNINWLGKKSLFSNPILKFISTSLGGIPVDRENSENTVEKISHTINASKKNICLVIAPEGTRSKKPGWHSGFYYIAQTANIPLGLGFTNYANRTMGIGTILYELRDINSDMQIIRDFYQNIVGKYPEKQSPVKIVVK